MRMPSQLLGFWLCSYTVSRLGAPGVYASTSPTRQRQTARCFCRCYARVTSSNVMPLVMLLPTTLQRRAIPDNGSCTVGRDDLKCTKLPAATYMFVSR
jgi:hypothetical protein